MVMSGSGANGLIHAGTPQFITKTVANSFNEKNTINITITINPPSQSSGLQYADLRLILNLLPAS